MTDKKRNWSQQGNQYDQHRGEPRQRENDEHRRQLGAENKYGQSGYGSRNQGGNWEQGNNYGPGGYGNSSEMNWENPERGSGSERGNWSGSQGGWDRDQDRGNWEGSSGFSQGYGSQGGWGSERYPGRGSDMYGSQSGWGPGSYGLGSSGWGGGAGSMGGYGSGREFGYGSRQYSGYGSSGGMNPNQERGFWNKTKDEVSSWFGDDEAERRRERDRRMNEMEERESTNYGYGASGSSYGMGSNKMTNRGKGPKDYRRSDDRIREDVSDRLADDERVDASEIEVLVNNSEVTLTGTVDSREAKRRAEDLAEQVSGVQNVQNNIRVNREGAASSRSETQGSGSSLYGSTGSSGSNATGSSGQSSQSGTGRSSSGHTGKDRS